MAPVGQYVFAEMLGISEHFPAGCHKWLPYSVIPTLFKTDLQTTICLQFGGECVWEMPETGGAYPARVRGEPFSENRLSTGAVSAIIKISDIDWS